MMAASNVAITTSIPLSSLVGSATAAADGFGNAREHHRADEVHALAASSMATRGFRARVETDVAIAFAVS